MMKSIFATRILSMMYALAFMGGIVACEHSDMEFDDPYPKPDEELPEEEKCFEEKSAWALGGGHENHVKYLKLRPYDPENAPGTEVLWRYLELEINGDEEHVHIGAVKFKELMEEEIPEGAAPGEYVKLMLRIDKPSWYFGPETENVKVQAYNEAPTGEINPDHFETHKGVAEVATGDDWEYYEVILPRFSYYSVYVGAKIEVECE